MQQSKTDNKLEQYLLTVKNFNRSHFVNKFMSDHNLEVESGRYKNVPRYERTCKVFIVMFLRTRKKIFLTLKFTEIWFVLVLCINLI